MYTSKISFKMAQYACGRLSLLCTFQFSPENAKSLHPDVCSLPVCGRKEVRVHGADDWMKKFSSTSSYLELKQDKQHLAPKVKVASCCKLFFRFVAFIVLKSHGLLER